MLYITTRNQQDIYTSYHALSNDCGTCGGLYIPFQSAHFTPEEISSLKEKSFSQCVADILNLFFTARLDHADIECCMGTSPLKLIPMSHRIIIGEIWNNPEWTLSRFIRNLSGRLLGSADNGQPSSWMQIVVRIAVFFGIFGSLERMGVVDPDRNIDISVCSGDFAAPMAAWYAREMGLPIRTIIFSCNENSASWDLLHHGEANMGCSVVSTSTPACDAAIPRNMERLVYHALGRAETERFVSHLASSSVYTLTEDKRKLLSDGIFGAVIGQTRTESIIRNVYRTNTYLLGPYTALAYGGLQDYRAASNETGPALILSECGPMCSCEMVGKAVGLSTESLADRICTI